MKKTLLLFAMPWLFASWLYAQQSITTLNSPSTQNFDGLGNSTLTWTDNTTLSNWYAGRTGATPITQIVASTGNAGGQLFNYGTVALPANRTMGTCPTALTGTHAFGLRLVNNTGSAVNGLRISYTGKQWRRSIATTQDLEFAYKVSSSPLISVEPGDGNGSNGWVGVSSLTFTSPITAVPPSVALDGNLTANQTQFTNVIVPVSWPAGAELMVRWRFVPAPSGNSHGLGIDDFSIEATSLPIVQYFSQPTGDLDLLNTWRDASNNPPTSFTSNFQVFNLVNRPASTLANNLTISGAASKLVVGNGTATTQLTVPSGIVLNATLDIRAQGKLSIASSTLPTFGLLEGSSEVEFNHTTPFTIPAGSYGILRLGGTSAKTFSPGITAARDIIVDNININFAPSNGSALVLGRNLNFNGTVGYVDPLNTPTLTTSGNLNQTINLNNNLLTLGSFSSSKSAGIFQLSAQSNIRINGITTLNYSGTAQFRDGGNTITAGGSFNADGLENGYLFTGTLVAYPFTDLVASTVNIRNSLSGGAIVARLNNLVATPRGAASVNISPSSGSATVFFKGSITVNQETATTGNFRFYNNTIRISGNLSNLRSDGNFVVLPNNLIVFEGTAPQTFAITNPAAPTLANITNSNTSTGGLSVSGNLQLSGNLIGSGRTTFANGNNLTMINGTAQILGGSGRLNLSGLTITNAAGVSLGAGARVDVRQFLKINPSSLFNVSAGTFTFLATSTSQANLLKVDGVIVGNVVYQKRMPGVPGGGWFFLSPVVQNQPVNSFAQRGNQYSGQTTNSLFNGGSFYSYDKFFTTFPQANGWRKPASLTETMNQTQGYRVYVNNTFFGQGGLFVFQGAPVIGSVSFPLSFCSSGCAFPNSSGNNGWSLVGNPYMCTIDWNSTLGWTKTNLSPTIHIWNAEQKTYATWDGISGTFGGSRYIAPGQSFFVEATATSPVLAATEDVKVNLSNLGLREAVDNKPTICHVRVEQGLQADEANVYFSDELRGFKNRKFAQSGLKLAVEGHFVSAGYALDENGRIPLEVSGAQAGNVTIRLNLQEAQTSVNVFLLDTEVNKLYPLKAGENIFEFTVNDPLTTAGRWVLQNQSSVVHTSDMITEKSLTVYPNPARHMLYLIGKDIQATQYQIKTISGRVMESKALDNNQINTSTLQPGVYLLSVTMKDGSSRNLKFTKE